MLQLKDSLQKRQSETQTYLLHLAKHDPVTEMGLWLCHIPHKIQPKATKKKTL